MIRHSTRFNSSKIIHIIWKKMLLKMFDNQINKETNFEHLNASMEDYMNGQVRMKFFLVMVTNFYVSSRTNSFIYLI